MNHLTWTLIDSPQNNQRAGSKETRKTGLCNIKQVDAFSIPPWTVS